MVIYSVILFLVDVVLVWYLIKNWGQFKARNRKFMVALVMIGGPLLLAFPVAERDFTVMKSKEFCMKCHEMHPFGESLKTDDTEPLSAVHAQNNYVPKATACYSCHADYSFFGPMKAKLNGLRHLFVHFTNSAPKKIKLYSPYNSENCLHCHGESKRFLKNKKHNTVDAPLEQLLNGQKTCLTAGCHDMGHLLESDDD